MNLEALHSPAHVVCPFCLPVDTQFRMSILERLEQMEQRMAEITNHNQSSETTATKAGGVEVTDHQSQVGVQLQHVHESYTELGSQFFCWSCLV